MDETASEIDDEIAAYLRSVSEPAHDIMLEFARKLLDADGTTPKDALVFANFAQGFIADLAEQAAAIPEGWKLAPTIETALAAVVRTRETLEIVAACSQRSAMH